MHAFRRFLVLAPLFLSSASPLLAQDDIALHPRCKFCDMDRRDYAHARILIEYGEGAGAGLCSLHCAAIDLALNIDRAPARIAVGDYATRQLIDAERAFWVIEGDIPGVMTQRAKWAFATAEGARAFTAKNGGTVAGFEEALQAAYEDLDRDTKIIRERRRAKRLQRER